MDATEPACAGSTRNRIDSWGLFFGRCMIACAVLCFATAVLDAAFHNPARMVRGNIQHAVHVRGWITLDFAKIAPFDWDDLCVIGPHTPQERIDTLLGFRWENSCTRRIERSDDHCLLLFVEGDRIAGFAELPRHECDFSELTGDAGLRLPRAEAVFEVDHTLDHPTAHPRSSRPLNVPRPQWRLAVR